MKRAVHVLLSFLLAVTFYSSARPLPPAQLLCWQAGRKLRWEDFQAPANVLPTDDPFFWTSAASCAPVLQVIGTKDAAGRNNFYVTAALDKSRSWVRDSALARSDQVLAHEQLHFDICELIARRLRQRIAQVYQASGDVFTLAFRQELQQLLAEQAVLNTRYDHETAHGLLRAQQQQWQQLLVRELAQVAAYESTASDCPYNE
jgi:AraC-like DNA-binding protein